MRLLTRISIVVGAALGVAVATPSIAQTLRVATNPTTPLGGPAPGGGFCVDLMAAIGERTGMQFEMSFIPLPEFFPSLTGNTIDVLCSSSGPTNQRRQLGVAFSSALYTNADALIVLATDTTPYTMAADFRGQRVAGVAGSAYLPVWANAGVDNVAQVATALDTYALLRSGEAKAALISGPAFLYRQRVLGQDTDLRLVETYVPVVVGYGALAVRDADTALLGTLQAALEALKADGTMATLLERWALPAPPF